LTARRKTRRGTHVLAAVAASALAVSLLAVAPAGAAKGGVKKFVRSAELNVEQGTATFPLLEGKSRDGDTVYYIVTEVSERAEARRLGVNWSPVLENALGTQAVQDATRTHGTVVFEGTVDFGPNHVVVPGPEGSEFPPSVAEPGSVGDAEYSPLFSVDGDTVVNATHIGNSTGLHDKVVSIDFENDQVVIDLTDGFYEDDPILYLSTDSSDQTAAAVEGATLAPNLGAAPEFGVADEESSALQALLAVVNGATGADNPDRQGLNSALRGEGDPLNVVAEVPDEDDYSPLWDFHPAVWTEDAIANGDRALITDLDDVPDLLASGVLESVAGGPANADFGGLRSAEFVINCPVIAEL
jgi:hypothetical protein